MLPKEEQTENTDTGKSITRRDLLRIVYVCNGKFIPHGRQCKPVSMKPGSYFRSQYQSSEYKDRTVIRLGMLPLEQVGY